MKNLHFIFSTLLLTFVLAFTACSDDEETIQLATPSITIGEVTESSFTFSVSAVEHATEYHYYVKKGNDEYVFNGALAASASQATVMNLHPHTTYHLKVVAVGSGKYTDSEPTTTDVTTTKLAAIAFNDPVLLSRLLHETTADADGDGQISTDEAEAVTSLDFGFDSEDDAQEHADSIITDLSGLEYFSSLQTLNLQYNKVKAAKPIQNLSTLTQLNLAGNPIESIDLALLYNLTDLHLFDTNIKKLNLRDPRHLEVLYVQRTKLTQLTLDGLPALQEVAANETEMENLEVTKCPKLLRLDAVKAKLQAAVVTDCPELLQLHLNGNQLQSLNMDGLGKLFLLNVYDNQLTSLNLGGCPSLMMLYAFDNQLKELDLSVCPKLYSCLLSNNPLIMADFSRNPGLTTLELENCAQLTEIDLKNGAFPEDWEYYIKQGNGQLRCVHVDAGAELEAVQKIFADSPNVTVTTE